MDRLTLLLLISILFSCDSSKEIRMNEMTFQFTDNVPETRHTVIANYITDEIKELKLENLKIRNIRVDSVPFSIVLYIPYPNQVTEGVEDNFKSLTNLLSEFDFNKTPVHAVLTDETFNPKAILPYDKDAVSYSGTTMVKGRAEVKLSESATRFSSEILEEVLRNRMPELYKGKDLVKFSVDMVNDTIKIDFNIDKTENNLDTLKKEFLNTDRLFFDLLFERRTILFHVRDKQNGQLITVFGLRGE